MDFPHRPAANPQTQWRLQYLFSRAARPIHQHLTGKWQQRDVASPHSQGEIKWPTHEMECREGSGVGSRTPGPLGKTNQGGKKRRSLESRPALCSQPHLGFDVQIQVQSSATRTHSSSAFVSSAVQSGCNGWLGLFWDGHQSNIHYGSKVRTQLLKLSNFLHCR